MTTIGLVLVALILLEGVRWVPMTTTAFARRPIGGYMVQRPRALRDGSRQGLLLPEPWLPSLGRFMVHAWPFTFGPAGVRRTESPLHADAVGWEQIAAGVQRGSRLVLPDGTTLNSGSADTARWLKALAGRVYDTTDAQRDATLRESVRAALDVENVQGRLDRLQNATVGADVLSWALFANVLLGPIAAPFVGSARVWPIWIGVHLLLAALAIGVYIRAARRLGPLAPADQLETVVMLLLYPPATVRFQDSLTRRVLTDVDSLPVAAILLRKSGQANTSDLQALARERLQTASQACSAAVPPDADWFNTQLKLSVENLVANQGISAVALSAAPPRESGANSFCPRCRTQYRVISGRCPDCREIDLVAFG